MHLRDLHNPVGDVNTDVNLGPRPIPHIISFIWMTTESLMLASPVILVQDGGTFQKENGSPADVCDSATRVNPCSPGLSMGHMGHFPWDTWDTVPYLQRCD